MPAPTDQDKVDTAFAMWLTGVKIPDISIATGIPVATIENLRSRRHWIAKRDAILAEEAGSARVNIETNLIKQSPYIMAKAIDLALNAESESVRAAQQRFLLGSLGISPDTATERMRQIQANADKLKAITQGQVIDIDASANTAANAIGWEE